MKTTTSFGGDERGQGGIPKALAWNLNNRLKREEASKEQSEYVKEDKRQSVKKQFIIRLRSKLRQDRKIPWELIFAVEGIKSGGIHAGSDAGDTRGCKSQPAGVVN